MSLNQSLLSLITIKLLMCTNMENVLNYQYIEYYKKAFINYNTNKILAIQSVFSVISISININQIVLKLVNMFKRGK